MIGGGGWNNSKLLARITKLNRDGYSIIRSVSRVSDDDLPALYGQSIIATLMSLHEGFGMTPLEALAAGARVVVSDIPVLREVCGTAVEYAPLDNKIEAMDTFSHAMQQRVNQSVVKDRLDRYTWPRATQKLIVLIDRLAELSYNISK